MPLTAHLHGSPGRLPFIGHFRAAARSGPVAFSVAGAVAARSEPQIAFDAARAVEAAFRADLLEGAADKVAVLGRVWEAILGIDERVLGPHQGRDFVALLAVVDEHGVGIAGPGLGGVWAWEDGGLTALVHGEHPLLGPPGRPERLPGILSLDEAHSRVVAVAHDHPVPNIQFSGLARRCGVSP